MSKQPIPNRMCTQRNSSFIRVIVMILACWWLLSGNPSVKCCGEMQHNLAEMVRCDLGCSSNSSAHIICPGKRGPLARVSHRTVSQHIGPFHAPILMFTKPSSPHNIILASAILTAPCQKRQMAIAPTSPHRCCLARP